MDTLLAYTERKMENEISEKLTEIIKIVSPNWKDYTLGIITVFSFLISCFTLYKVWTINSRYKKKQKNTLFINKLKNFQDLLNDKSKEKPSDIKEQVIKAFKNYAYHVNKKNKKKELDNYIKRLESENIINDDIKDIIDNAVIDFEEGVA